MRRLHTWVATATNCGTSNPAHVAHCADGGGDTPDPTRHSGTVDVKMLPREARQRLTASTGPEDGPAGHGPAIPVTAEGWASVLEDAGLTRDGDFADSLEGTHVAAASEDPTTIRDATRKLAAATDRLLADLLLIEAFRPSRDGRTAHARVLIRHVANDALEAVVNRDVTGQVRRRRALAELVDSMTRHAEIVDDRLQAVF